ncbi:MAG: helix-turn-helix domain-containing protein [Sandaracinaceae bacterium]
MPDSLGARITAARLRAGLNRNQLARALGASWQQVDHWESDRVQPTLNSIRGLTELLGVTSDYLLGLSDELGEAPPSALESFLAANALSPEEERWLRDAPVDHAALERDDYANLVRQLRGAATRTPPPRTGPRKKVDRSAIEASVRARGIKASGDD